MHRMGDVLDLRLDIADMLVALLRLVLQRSQDDLVEADIDLHPPRGRLESADG